MSELLEFLRTHEEAFRSRARLASLYSDFRSQRQTNPDGYVANTSAWLRALQSAAKAGLIPSQTGGTSGGLNDRFTIHTGEDLAKALQSQEFGKPLALGAVVEDAVQRGDLIQLKEFLEKKESVYVKRKSPLPTIGQVLGWGLRQLGVIGQDSGEDRFVKGDFVILGNVEVWKIADAADAVIKRAAQVATGNTARVFTKELFSSTFVDTIGVPSLSINDTSILLTHLARDKSAISYSPQTGTIKFKAPGESQPAPIEQEDETIASLRTLIGSLERQTENLTTRITALEKTARDAVANKNLTAAKAALRSKKLAESTVEKRTATLTQLEEVYNKIEQAANQVDIVRVMEASSQALRNLNAKTGGVEHVQDVMEGLQEEMGNVDEINNVLNEASAGTIDDGEVDDELEEMERVEREKREAIERVDREKREAIDKADREKKDAEDAEETRRRLAELEPPSKAEEAQKEREALNVTTAE
ncbi:Hypothetical protein R9X50_00765100 [Acrodontium crateriforme]|uniref:Uncharacterized protein n=1 Tax=Acrodontium crateriforme TaxID=150365 RepID=A0AAQ3RCE8_9PEZI|nr:Hypothetical protein R9X50_00765100 [Acrodontium crateriforme]